MQIEGFLIDIDGCIISTQGEIPFCYYDGVCQVSHYVSLSKIQGFPPISFCTGRDRNYVEAIAFFLGLPNSWSVIESGIALFNPTTKEMLINPLLTPELGKTFVDISNKVVPQILKGCPGLFLYPGNMINIALEAKGGHNPSLIEKSYQIVNELLADLVVDKKIIVHHTDSAVDISPAGIDKASGVRFWSQVTGINLNEVVGIGDSNGDFPMLNLVGYTGCPANASNTCKTLVERKGGYISPLKYAEGVADILGYFTES